MFVLYFGFQKDRKEKRGMAKGEGARKRETQLTDRKDELM